MRKSKTVKVVRYNPGMKEEWDMFVQKAKNGHFLFYRDYMEYHSDKYPDSSLLFYLNKKLYALFPGSVKNNILISHPGLTFGGFIINRNTSLSKTQMIFSKLREYSLQNGYINIIYKVIPHIYHKYPAQEDLFVLFDTGATLIRRDLSSAIEPEKLEKYSKGRISSINKAKKKNMRYCQSNDFKTFMDITANLLKEKYNSIPVHTTEELTRLASQFPKQIKLFVVKKKEKILAGVVIYETENVAHCQYIASSREGKEVKALDFLLDRLIRKIYISKKYFDFGTSKTTNGELINWTLLKNKESFGGRGVVYDTYRIDIL